MLIDGKQLRPGSIADDRLANPAGKPSSANKGMTALATTADFDPACATGITTTPRGDVQVHVNGVSQLVGDGVKTSDCYFGATATVAKAISAIVAGDKVFWVGSVAGFQLAVTDRISFVYNS